MANMKIACRRIAALLLLLITQAGSAAYITDKLLVGLYPEPSNKTKYFKILTSGAQLKILERQTGYIKVQLHDGTEGWVERRYIIDEKPAALMLSDANKENESLKGELDQVRQELIKVQKELSSKPTSASETNQALTKANKRIAELESQLKAKPNQVPTESGKADPRCEHDLENMEIKQLQCQMRLAKRSKGDKDSVFTENERLRDIMQEAVNLLGLKPSGEVPALVYGNPTPLPTSAPAATDTPVEPEAPTEESQQGMPIWIYLVFLLTLITGIIGGFALFDYRTRKGISARL